MVTAPQRNVPYGEVYDDDHNLLSFKYAEDNWRVFTYDEAGKVKTYVSSTGWWCEYFRDIGVYVRNFVVWKI